MNDTHGMHDIYQHLKFHWIHITTKNSITVFWISLSYETLWKISDLKKLFTVCWISKVFYFRENHHSQVNFLLYSVSNLFSLNWEPVISKHVIVERYNIVFAVPLFWLKPKSTCTYLLWYTCRDRFLPHKLWEVSYQFFPQLNHKSGLILPKAVVLYCTLNL